MSSDAVVELPGNWTLTTCHADRLHTTQRLAEGLSDNASSEPSFSLLKLGCRPHGPAVCRGLSKNRRLAAGCRSATFLDTSNTLHRHACARRGGDIYCGHFYAPYFLKDQISALGGGHRCDWEHAAIWTKTGVVTHGGYSAHGKLYNQEIGALDQQDGHMKIGYHKDGALTHCMRFAKAGEVAENAYGQFVTPDIISWQVLWGDGRSNAQMRAKLDAFDYGSGVIPMRDDTFIGNLNT